MQAWQHRLLSTRQVYKLRKIHGLLGHSTVIHRLQAVSTRTMCPLKDTQLS